METLKTLSLLIIPIISGLLLASFGAREVQTSNFEKIQAVNEIQTRTIEGISYLTDSPIDINIENGIITRIQK